jgi:hypothetical protein
LDKNKKRKDNFFGIHAKMEQAGSIALMKAGATLKQASIGPKS